MRYSQSEKMQIIRLVDESAVSVKQTLFELNINRSTFYKCIIDIKKGALTHWPIATVHRSNSGMRYRLGRSSVWLKRLLNTRKSHRVS